MLLVGHPASRPNLDEFQYPAPRVVCQSCRTQHAACKRLRRLPVLCKDGLCREHGGHNEGLRQAAQISSCNKHACQAGIQGQARHLLAQGCYSAIPINCIEDEKLPQGILQSFWLQPANP